MMATNGRTANRQPANGAPDGTNQALKAVIWLRDAAGARLHPACLAAAVLLAGCSSQQAYRSLQEMEQSRCTDWPAHLYRECLEASDATYREYEAARDQADEASG